MEPVAAVPRRRPVPVDDQRTCQMKTQLSPTEAERWRSCAREIGLGTQTAMRVAMLDFVALHDRNERTGMAALTRVQQNIVETLTAYAALTPAQKADIDRAVAGYTGYVGMARLAMLDLIDKPHPQDVLAA